MNPTFHGLVFLKDDIGRGFIPGLVLLIFSLFLVNKGDKNVKFSVNWIICVILCFIGNKVRLDDSNPYAFAGVVVSV